MPSHPAAVKAEVPTKSGGIVMDFILVLQFGLHQRTPADVVDCLLEHFNSDVVTSEVSGERHPQTRGHPYPGRTRSAAQSPEELGL